MTEQASKDDLTSSQREALELIKENPEATQGELAEELDISPASVSARVSGIDGLDWSSRAEDVKKYYEDEEEASDDQESAEQEQTDEKVEDDRLERIRQQLTNVSHRLNKLEEKHEVGSGPLGNRDLSLKLVKVALKSGEFDEEEENELIEKLT